jgi:hypothetical protein
VLKFVFASIPFKSLARHKPHDPTGRIVPANVVLGSSIVAAAVAAVATNPLDIIKTTYQTAGPGGLASVAGEVSMWGVAKRVCRQQGFVGLFTKGLRARAPYVIMDMSLGMFTFDFFFHFFHGKESQEAS